MEKTTEKEYKLAPISEKQIKALGVQSLADRPNTMGGYGQSGLSPTQLKLAFDKLVTLASSKINELQEALTGEDAAKYIGLALKNYKTLDEFLCAMQNGNFASDFLMVYPSADVFELSTLQNVLNAAAKLVSGHDESIKKLDEDLKKISENIKSLKGEPGDSGVYVGSGTPPENANVWIDPDGEGIDTEVFTFRMTDGRIIEKNAIILD